MNIENSLYTYKAKVLSVYDGDTYTLKFDLGFKISVEHKVRMLYIDTPELRGEEREAGLVVRDVVREHILGKEVVVKTHRDKSGKYGRYLVELYIEEMDQMYNIWLIDNGHAEPYM